MMRRSTWVAHAAVALLATGAFGQCDTATPGNFIDTEFNSQADCNGGNDTNGGSNFSDQYLETGTYGPGDSFRVTGVVGNFDRYCDGVYNSRDLDWVRFSVSEPCYITVKLSMRDSNGDAFDGTNTYDFLYIDHSGDIISEIPLYEEYGTDGCPHTAKYTFANGTQQALIPIDAGDYVVIATTLGFFWEPLYHGPLPYGLDVSFTAYAHEECVNSEFGVDCITTHATGGCSDGACCDLVCGFTPHCCDTAWDASCVQGGVDHCGNYIYACTDPWIFAPNDCAGHAELVTNLPAFINFDCTGANTDGPNDPTRLCSSSTTHDIWYVVGPTPYAGDLVVSMCGQGNIADSVISMYDLGSSSDIGNPQDLPAKYVACRDDNCDDDGDGDIDLAGPSSISLLGVPANNYILVRVGKGLDLTNPNAPGFAGSMEISFRAVFVNHGLQSVTNNNGGNTNLGLISGWSTAALPKRWSMVPFEMPIEGIVDGFDFAAFDNTTPDQVEYKIMVRDVNGGAYGSAGRPFGDGNYVGGQIIASGVEWLDMDAHVNVGDDAQQRFFIDVSNPFHLSPGSYYFSIYGSNSDGSTGGSFAWLLYGRKGMPQATTAPVTISAADAASAASQGTFPAGTPFGWRSTGTGPKFCFYNLGPSYTAQPGDDPRLLYQCAFNLKGQIIAACFGDLDGSGEVDGGDIGLVLLDFGPCPGCTTDLDDSGEVDGGDIGLVLLSFGACP